MYMSDLLVYKNSYWTPFKTFTYSGSPEEFTLQPGRYLIECNGAPGGLGTQSYQRLKGGTTYGILDLDEATTMYAVVGGTGGDGLSKTEPGPGGYNGGANGGAGYSSDYYCGAGGGGATDIRLNLDPDEETITEYHSIPDSADEVEYVNAGDYARIDTGIVFDPTIQVECVCKTSVKSGDYYALFGARNAPLNNAFAFWFRFNNSDRPAYATGNYEAQSDSATFPTNQIVKVVTSGRNAKWYDENDVELGSVTTNADIMDSTRTVKIWEINDGTGNKSANGHVDMYYFKIWKGGKLVRYFVPFQEKTNGEEMDVSNITFSVGDINSSTGVPDPIDSPSRQDTCKTNEFIPWNPINRGIKLEVSITTNGDTTDGVSVFFYDKKKNFISSTEFKESGYRLFTVPENTYFIKARVGYFSITTMTPEDIVSFNVHAYPHYSQTNGMFDLVENTWYTSGYGFTTGNVKQTKTSIPVYGTIHHSLLSRIIVAGGGGGNSYTSAGKLPANFYGVGGGANGGALFVYSSDDPNNGKQATQMDGYSFGTGQTPPKRSTAYAWSAEGAAGGGGGWFGGYASNDMKTSNMSGPGGGGSGYVLTASSYRPPYYDQHISSKYYFTDTVMLGGNAEQASIVIYKNQKSFANSDTLKFPCVGWTEQIMLGVGEYVFKCWGGWGGPTYNYTSAAHGGYAEGKFKSDEPHETFINVGGSGIRYGFTYDDSITCNPTLSYNGGGIAGDLSSWRSTFGGGASDIRIDTDSLYARIIVAGGAGGHGAGEDSGNRFGGAGGGLEGAWSSNSNYGNVPGPGTQTGTPTNERVGGAFGLGGNGCAENGGFGGAGGGGWYGGSGCIPDTGSNDDRGGCGGSGYVFTPTSNRPIGYLLNDELVLTDTVLTQGGNNLAFGITKVEIDVIETNFMQYLCKDEEGLKTFNKQQNEWVIIGNDDPTLEDLQEHGCYALKNVDELVGNVDIWILDPADNGFNNVHAYVIPCKQTITATKYTHNLVSSISIDGDIDSDNVDFKAIVNRKGSYEDSRVELLIECDIHDEPTMQTKLYAIHAYTQGQTSYQIPQKKEKTLQHIDLLSVGLGNSIPYRYKAYLGTHINVDEAITEITSACSCEKNRNIYSCVLCNNKVVRFVKLSLVNNHSSLIRDVQLTSMGGSGKKFGDIIVDDEYMYVTYANNDGYRVLYRVPFDPSGEVTSYSPGNNSRYNFESFGKMEWYDDHTIIIDSRNGFLLFDTETLRWTEKYYSTKSTARADFAVGKKYAFSIYKGNSSDGYVCEIETNNWFTFGESWSNAYQNVICYGDGKFYVVQRNMLHIVDEETLHIEERIVTPFSSGDPRSIDYTNGVIYITMQNSYVMYIYDIKNNRWTQLSLPFQIKDFSEDGWCRPCAFRGFYFVPNMRLYTTNFVEYTKYNLGYKYDTFSFVFDTDSEPDYDYDIRFVSFSDSFMSIHNGYIDYPITVYDPDNHIYKATLDSSEYNKLFSVELQQIEDEGDDDNNG